jgi:protein gp37
MGETSIEWTDRSINPIRARNVATGSVGHFCEKISPGCARCYAAAWNLRVRRQRNMVSIGTGLDYLPANREKVSLWLDHGKLREVLRRKKPTTWFWCDMTDMFGEWVPDEWIDACFATMALTPQHTHQVLTKRALRMRAYFEDLDDRSLQIGAAAGNMLDGAWIWQQGKRFRPAIERLISLAHGLDYQQEDGEEIEVQSGEDLLPLANVWLGVSAEDQKHWDERVPHLVETPAAVRFVSAEPLMGPIRATLRRCDECGHVQADDVICHGCNRHTFASNAIDWLIVGGESHQDRSRARVCNIEWARSLLEQCHDVGVACFIKQLGSRPALDSRPLTLRHPKGGDPSEWPEDIQVRQFPQAREKVAT